MAFLQGKTPISFLQELCTKRGITPQYDLIANEGAVHEPTFVFKVVAGEFMGTGKGASKKKAKHNAAQSILNQMMGVGDSQSLMVDPSQSGANGGSADGNEEGNPVGELQEMTQKRMWPPPVYDYSTEQGPPHAKEFVCTVRLVHLQEKGVGKSKKVAKRNAALNMIQLLKKGGGEPQEAQAVAANEEETDVEHMPLPNSSGDLQMTYTTLKKDGGYSVPTLTIEHSQQITQFYHKLKSSTSGHLVNLQQNTLNNAEDYVQMLQEIAAEQKFEVTYVDITEPTSTGECQCLVQLSTYPVGVCQGVASTKNLAKARAALNALQYLKIMAKPNKKQ